MYNKEYVEELKTIYSEISPVIERRLKEFKRQYEEADDRYVFSVLAFCLLTPQSKARICWRAIERLQNDNSLFTGDQEQIREKLIGVRFKNNKSKYIVKAREFFTHDDKLTIKEVIEEFKDVYSLRDFLVKNIKGIGYKEASHFIRNIGKGEDIAILDRHILKNMVKLNILDSIPSAITKKFYFDLENKLRDFANYMFIRMDELDLLLWYKQAGEVFK